MILRLVREGLGRLIVLVDFITRPKPLQRSDEDQQKVDDQTKALSLYQFYACPFCVKVRRVIHQLNLSIEYRDAQHHPDHRQTLLEEGGRIKVPCLRIQEGNTAKWLYESRDIIDYIRDRF